MFAKTKSAEFCDLPVQTVRRRHHPLVSHQGAPTKVSPLAPQTDLPGPLPVQGRVATHDPQARIQSVCIYSCDKSTFVCTLKSVCTRRTTRKKISLETKSSLDLGGKKYLYVELLVFPGYVGYSSCLGTWVFHPTWVRGLFFLPGYVGYSSYLGTWVIHLTWVLGLFVLPGYLGYSSYLGTWVNYSFYVGYSSYLGTWVRDQRQPEPVYNRQNFYCIPERTGQCNHHTGHVNECTCLRVQYTCLLSTLLLQVFLLNTKGSITENQNVICFMYMRVIKLTVSWFQCPS